MFEDVARRIEAVQNEIEPCKPVIIAVTKYFDEHGIIAYYNAGLRDFGENRVADALSKFERLPEEIRKNSRFHLIGHLQTNKVKDAVGKFDLIHSVDSVKLARKISSEACEKGIVQDVLVQINNADEQSKFGFRTDCVFDAFAEIVKLPGLNVKGVMNIAPLSDDEKYLAGLFAQIREIRDKLRSDFNVPLPIISEGMSNDYKIAVQQGSTMIRLGRVLFR